MPTETTFLEAWGELLGQEAGHASRRRTPRADERSQDRESQRFFKTETDLTFRRIFHATALTNFPPRAGGCGTAGQHAPDFCADVVLNLRMALHRGARERCMRAATTVLSCQPQPPRAAAVRGLGPRSYRIRSMLPWHQRRYRRRGPAVVCGLLVGIGELNDFAFVPGATEDL